MNSMIVSGEVLNGVPIQKMVSGFNFSDRMEEKLGPIF
jgi:hypothetical protein